MTAIATEVVDKEIEVRSFKVRAVDTEKREISGVAVPWGQIADIGGYYREIIERGAVVDSDAALAFYLHDRPVGKITRAEDTDDGWEITMRLSETELGNEAYTLARDGVLSHMSIGFRPIEHRDEISEEDGSVTRTRTKIKVHEVSLVPFPAYEGAKVTQVREATKEKENHAMAVDLVTRADLDEVHTGIEDMERRMTSLIESAGKGDSDGIELQYRSFGEYVKAVAKGDEVALRAYEGAVSGDTVVKNGWITDLYKIMRERQRITRLFQHSYTLPSEGMNVEYGVVKSDTTQVGVQAAEGDNLLYGKVVIDTETAPVKTLGGWSSLSRQAIERTSVNVLDLTFTALANKYARAVETLTRLTLTTAYNDTTATELDTVEGDLTTQDGVIELLIDLIEHFEDNDLNLDGLLLAKSEFIALSQVPATDRILQVTGAPTDKTGTLAIETLSGRVANVPFHLWPSAPTGGIVAFDQLAIKTLEAPGAPLRLQDENVVNLTKDFSVYGYASSFTQWRDGLVKVEAPVVEP